MQKTKEISLAPDFKQKCKEILRKQSDIYLSNFIRGQNLEFNTKTFKIDDMPFLQVMFILPFKSIKIFQQEQIAKKYKSKNSNADDKEANKNQPKKFYQTGKFNQLLTILSTNIADGKLNSLRTLRFQNIPILLKHIRSLTNGIQKTKFLKQLCIAKCSLTDAHLQSIKSSLCTNVSLNKLDFSYNQLKESGGMIGKILSEHGRRKNQIQYIYSIRNLKPEFDLANTGIYEVNLEGNYFNDKSVQQLIPFINNDKWIRCINVKNNKIQEQGIKKFIRFLKNNSTIMNLDLRQNQGLTKPYSKLIFQKLMLNIQNFKKLNKPTKQRQQSKSKNQNNSKMLQEIPLAGQYISRKSTNQQLKQNSHQFNPQFNSFRQSLKLQLKSKQSPIKQSSNKYLLSNNILSKQQNYHSQRRKLQTKASTQKKDLTTLNSKQMVSNQLSNNKSNMNHTAFQNISKYSIDQSQNKGYKSRIEQEVTHNCKKCQDFHLRALKAEKENKQLSLQLLKLKNIIGKNFDLSVIGLSSSNRLNISNLPALNPQLSNISTSFNKINLLQNQDEWFPKMQNLMSQLTKIMQIVQLNQNTQNTIQNAFQNINSLSKTISLYQKPKQINENHQQIQEQLQMMLHMQQIDGGSVSIIESTRNRNKGRQQKSIDKNKIKNQNLHQKQQEEQ